MPSGSNKSNSEVTKHVRDWRYVVFLVVLIVALSTLRMFFPSFVYCTTRGVFLCIFNALFLGFWAGIVFGVWDGFTSRLGIDQRELQANCRAIFDGMAVILAFILTAYISPDNASYQSAAALLSGGLALGILKMLLNRLPDNPFKKK